MQKDYAYGGKKTAFNGVWGWLQRAIVLPKDPNKSAAMAGKICRDFLTANSLPCKTKKDNYSMDINCQTIQKTFTKFTQFVKENAEYEKLKP